MLLNSSHACPRVPSGTCLQTRPAFYHPITNSKSTVFEDNQGCLPQLVQCPQDFPSEQVFGPQLEKMHLSQDIASAEQRPGTFTMGIPR